MRGDVESEKKEVSEHASLVLAARKGGEVRSG